MMPKPFVFVRLDRISVAIFDAQAATKKISKKEPRGPSRPGEPKGNPTRRQRRPKNPQKRAPNAGKQRTRAKKEFLENFAGPKYVEKQSVKIAASQHDRKQHAYFPRKNARRINAPQQTPIENRMFVEKARACAKTKQRSTRENEDFIKIKF